MRRGLTVLAVILLVAAVVGWRLGWFEEALGDRDGVTFGFTPWTTTYPGTYVARVLIEDELGYATRLEEADVAVVYAGLARGDIDVFMDAWLPDMHRDYVEQYGETIEDLGSVYQDAILGWGVPEYVDEGLRSIAHLNQYRELFEGRVIGIDPGAGMSRTSEEIIEAYGLEYDYLPSSEAAMLVEVASAFSREEPVLFLVYRPHTMFVRWDIRVLEDPMGFWRPSDVHVMAHEGLREKAPEVHGLLSRFEMPIEDYEEWILRQDEHGEDPEALAEDWIARNPELVQSFLAATPPPHP